jgi:hypothetical protein
MCDCLGKSICKINTCGLWRAIDQSAAAPLAGTTNVACTFENSGKCQEKIDMPVEYKMVQLGSTKRAEQMFNMTWQKDKGDFITNRFASGRGAGMHGVWPDKEKLKPRQLNIHLYQGDADPSSKFVCAIINAYDIPEDGLGIYGVDSEITSLNGEAIRFMQCDDWSGGSQSGECLSNSPGTALTAHHRGLAVFSDGWCVGPLHSNGNAISVKFSKISLMRGINFLGSDGAVTEYSFFGSTVAGLTGDIDSNGLVTNGAVPEIIINLAGIEVP